MRSEYLDFLFVDVSTLKKKGHDEDYSLCSRSAASLCLTVLPTASALLTSGALASAVATACIPIIVPISAPLNFDSDSIALTEEAKLYVKGLLFASGVQASLAVFDLMVGDLTRAIIKGLFGGLGWYVTRPEGLSSLSSFTMVSFLSGSINGIAALQMMLASKGPIFSGLLPLVINYIRFADLAHPVFCLGSAYCAWMLLKELRRVNAVITDRSEEPDTQSTSLLTGGTSLRRRLPGASSVTEFRPFQGTGHSLSAVSPMATSSVAPAVAQQ
jgi:hypothetical protein